MVEIFANSLVVSVCEDTDEVLVVNGKGWEGDPFKVYLTMEEVRNLLWQLSFFCDNPAFE